MNFLRLGAILVLCFASTGLGAENLYNQSWYTFKNQSGSQHPAQILEWLRHNVSQSGHPIDEAITHLTLSMSSYAVRKDRQQWLTTLLEVTESADQNKKIQLIAAFPSLVFLEDTDAIKSLEEKRVLARWDELVRSTLKQLKTTYETAQTPKGKAIVARRIVTVIAAHSKLAPLRKLAVRNFDVATCVEALIAAL